MARRILHAVVVAGSVLAGFVLAIVVAWGIDLRAHDGQVNRNVRLAGRTVGGLGEQSLRRAVEGLVPAYEGAPVTVRTPDSSFTTDTDALGAVVDVEATVRSALDVGRSGPVIGRIWSWLWSPLNRRTATVDIDADERAVREVVAAKDPGPRQAPTEPGIRWTEDGFEVVAGRDGRGIDARDVMEGLAVAAGNGLPIAFRVEPGPIPPRFTEGDAERLAAEAERTVAEAVEVRAGSATAEVPATTLRSWVTAVPMDDELRLGLNRDTALADLEQLLAEAGRPARDASFTVSGGTVQIRPGEDGTRCCDPDGIGALEQEVLAGGDGPVELPLRRRPPERTVEDARALNIVEPVASFTTNHAAGQSRVTNIHRIADLIRGQVIEPGKVFSVNGFVGRRTTAKGFVSAGVIEDGRFTDDVGGGISQFATTLFNAAFFAGLEFEEYQSHSIYISRYPYGREATLSYPRPDLKIRNNTPHGVLIWPTYTSSSITVTLYSTKWVEADQTGQRTSPRGNCTRVTTERTRKWLEDGRTEVDRVYATYRPGEGVNC